MNTLSEETPRVKSSGSSTGSSGKKRRRSIDITSFEKSSGEEVNNVPNYRRGSTGYCHDFCNYGKHHEHVKSAIPINFKQTTVVDKDKVAKTVVPVEKKERKHYKQISKSRMFVSRIASKIREVGMSKVKALVNAFETMISASKLAERRKSKVKALVDAFETVISLQDGKPSST
ncbi:putative calmodulin-binding domain containing protein [Tanacetum coccineum]